MRIASLHCYPIKGCRGHDLATAEVDALGVVDDRRLMLVDAANRFISQREQPLLATVEPERNGTQLTVRVGDDTLSIDVRMRGHLRTVGIWSNSVEAIDQGEDAATWFSDMLGQHCRLVAFGDDSRRPIDRAFSPRSDAQTAFTDGYPLLGVLQESLDDLNTRLESPVPMGRFRPNVVVSGAEAWSEDHWRGMKFGSLAMDGVKPCARCVVPTTDQRTGARHPLQEPLRTLSTFRVQRPFGTIFGMNLVPRVQGAIAVGDTVSPI